MFGIGRSNMVPFDKDKVLELTSDLVLSMNNQPPNYEEALVVAVMIRDIVKRGASLTGEDKVRLIRSFALAKAKAYVSGNQDDYHTYRELDNLSDEIVRLL